MLIPAGMTLVKIGKQANGLQWPSGCVTAPFFPWRSTLLPLKFFSDPRPLFCKDLTHFSRVPSLILWLVWPEIWTADGGLISIPASTYKPNGMCVRPVAVSGEAGEHVLLEDENCTLPVKLHLLQSHSLIAGKRSVLSPCYSVLFLHRAIQNDAKTATQLRHLGVCLRVLLSVAFM